MPVDEARRQVNELRRDLDNLERSVTRSVALLNSAALLIRRISGSEDVDSAARKLQSMIMLMNTLRTTAMAMQAATGPIGLAMFGISMATTVASTYDVIMDLGP